MHVLYKIYYYYIYIQIRYHENNVVLMIMWGCDVYCVGEGTSLALVLVREAVTVHTYCALLSHRARLIMHECRKLYH